jgi:hypothetical protein
MTRQPEDEPEHAPALVPGGELELSHPEHNAATATVTARADSHLDRVRGDAEHTHGACGDDEAVENAQH